MGKQTKPEEPERRIGPKFSRSVLPDNYQIRRQPAPMAELLREAERERTVDDVVRLTPDEITPVKITPVESAGVPLPDLDAFLDQILPRFPAARQAILLRLYRWSDGQ